MEFLVAGTMSKAALNTAALPKPRAETPGYNKMQTTTTQIYNSASNNVVNVQGIVFFYIVHVSSKWTVSVVSVFLSKVDANGVDAQIQYEDEQVSCKSTP